MKPLHKSCQASVIFLGGKKGAYWVMIDEEHAFGNYSTSIYDDLKVPLFFWCFSLERHIKNKVQRCAIFC